MNIRQIEKTTKCVEVALEATGYVIFRLIFQMVRNRRPRVHGNRPNLNLDGNLRDALIAWTNILGLQCYSEMQRHIPERRYLTAFDLVVFRENCEFLADNK